VKTIAWNDLNHKVPMERREQLKREAVAELDRMGFASLRKARQQTQVELADKLGIDRKRPSNTPVGGWLSVMNSGHERGC
jgi:hypothetical protein